MAYNKTAWNAGRAGNTAVNVARLDNMEDGIAAAARTWQPGEVLTAGEVRVAPDGHVITRNANGTARGSYDATEQALWTVVGGGGAVSDATTGAKGVVQLAGDLAGTAAAPTVAKIGGVTPAPVATSGAYSDLSGKPTIPAVQQVAGTVTSSGALVVNKHNPVDASGGAKAMTLPTGQAEGTQISVEKTDVSTNAVTVTGSIRGVGSATVTLPWQNEDIVLRADSSGSWWPISGHKTKAALDSAYGIARRPPVVAYPGIAGKRNNTIASGSTNRTAYGFHVAAGNLRFTYAHQQTTASGDVAPSGSITIGASFEYGGTIYPITFGGRTQVTIDPGGVVTSDPLGVDVTTPSRGWVRTYLASGTAYANYANFGGQASKGGTAAGDLTAVGSGTITDSEVVLLGPVSITGDTVSTLPVVIGNGDSITAGQGDEVGTFPANSGNASGWFERAFAGLRGYINLSQSSETAAGFVTNAGHMRRGAFITPGCWAVASYGRNDVSGAATTAAIEATLVAHWNMLVTRGARVAAITITPNTTSTDGWVTTTNQTVANAGAETKRVAVNTWLRDGAPISAGVPVAVGTGGASRAAVYASDKTPVTAASGPAGHPLSFVIETADTVESARNSGLWKASTSGDGLHPLPAGAAAMAVAVPVSLFV